MATLGQGIFYLLGDRSNLDQTMASAEADTKSSVGRINSFLKGAFQVAIGGFLQQGVQSLAGSIKESMIGTNASFETTTLQFKTLMGSADEASAHVKDLFKFAKDTPFETGPVIEASRFMRLFGGAALDTKENLTLFGDAAAATGANIQEVGFWSSRMYAAIQGGQPIGEATMRLQELGIITPQVSDKMRDMEKAGASSAEVWKVYSDALLRYKGAMAEQATTWTGLTSSIADAFNILGAQLTKPIFDLAKAGAGQLLDVLSGDGVQAAVDSFASWLETAIADAIMFGRQMYAIGSDAWNWGAGWAEQIAAGFEAGLAYLESVMDSVSSMLSYWLQPNSPPRVAKDLDKWATASASVYWAAWGKGDMSVFDDMKGALKNALDAMVDTGAIDKTEVIPRMLFGEAGVSRLINDFRDTGRASDEAMGMIRDAAGPVADDIEDVVRSYANLEEATAMVNEAQQELNETTAKYDAILNPLNAQMKAIKDQEQAIEDQKDLADLDKKIADKKTSDADRQLAILKKQEIQLRQQIDVTEDQKQVEEDTAKARVDASKQSEDAAKDAFDASKAMLQQHQDENSELAQQVKLLRDIAEQEAKDAEKEAKKGRAGGGGRKAGGGGGAKNPMEGIEKHLDDTEKDVKDRMSKIQHAITDPIDNANNHIKTTLADMDKRFGGIGSGFLAQLQGVPAKVRTIWEEVKAVFTGGNGGDDWAKQDTTVQKLAGPWIEFGYSVVERLKSTFRLAKEIVITAIDEISNPCYQIKDNALAAFTALSTATASVFTFMNDTISKVMDAVSTFISTHRGEIETDVAGMWDKLSGIIQAGSDIIQTIVGALTKAVHFIFVDHATEVQQVIQGLWDVVAGIFDGSLAIIEGLLKVAKDALTGDWTALGNDLQTMGTTVWNDIVKIIEGAFNAIAALFGTNMGDLNTLWSDNFTKMGIALSTWWDGVKQACSDELLALKKAWNDTLDSIQQQLADAVPRARQVASDLVDGLVQGIKNGLGAIKQAAWDLVSGFFGAAKSAAQSQSPSKRAENEVGLPLAQGTALGITKNIGLVVTAAKGLMESVFKAMTDMAEEFKGFMSDTLTEALTGSVSFTSTQQGNIKQLNDLFPSVDDIKAKKKDIESQLQDAGALQLFDDAIKAQQDALDKSNDALKDNQKSIEDTQKQLDDLRAKPIVAFSDEERAQIQAERDALAATLQAKVDDLKTQGTAIQGDINAENAEIARQQILRQSAIDTATDAWRTRQQAVYDAAKGQLQDAESDAKARFAGDAQAQADYFKLRSDQIFRVAELQQQINEATNDSDRKSFQDQMAMELALQKQQADLWVSQREDTLQGKKDEMVANVQSQLDAVTAKIKDDQDKINEFYKDRAKNVADLQKLRDDHSKAQSDYTQQIHDLEAKVGHGTKAENEKWGDELAKLRDQKTQEQADFDEKQKELSDKIADIDQQKYTLLQEVQQLQALQTQLTNLLVQIGLAPIQGGVEDLIGSIPAPNITGGRPTFPTGAQQRTATTNTFYITTSAPIEPIVDDSLTLAAIATGRT